MTEAILAIQLIGLALGAAMAIAVLVFNRPRKNAGYDWLYKPHDGADR